ncbi:hypothetical protein Syun_022951 [Stephania yunnanensis]|uniref:Fatty acid hydroxylase domain-containing protein n=1 Tax=Stephania yunnanensis TaxID=152371 RepID=A0AAP0FAE5_9MAGN
MALQPGILTEWPWAKLGRFKYLVLAPWVAHSTYSFISSQSEERDLSYLLIFPFLMWRVLHNQIWISFARYQTAKGNNMIVDKSIDFQQVDRESNWDDNIILSGVTLYVGRMTINGATNFPLWRGDGVILTILLHTGPVEFLYYWFHRALHHHFLYSRYHSHHHSSIVTEPITSVIHPFAELVMYILLFAIPTLATISTGTKSIVALVGYITYIDFMNNLGHCNFEFVPTWLFELFPLLKYFMYTPSFHSLHHTKFRTNYSLFMPIYDYIYGTADKSSDSLYETSLKRQEESPNLVHLTHFTTIDSIYHSRLGFASWAASPYSSSRWYLKLLTWWSSTMLRWMLNHPIVVERHKLNQLNLQTWAVPRYKFHYGLPWEKEEINALIEEAILEVEKANVKVMSLGLLNQDQELNKHGALFIQKHPNMKLRVVDGSGLAVATVLHSIPKGTKQVFLHGNIISSKVIFAIVKALILDGVQVVTPCKDQVDILTLRFAPESQNNVILSTSYAHKVWLVGESLEKDEQARAPKGTLFIPFSQFPIAQTRKDCVYYNTPAMKVPEALENMHSCENWLPRRVMSAWRVAGIVHALEGWNEHECGETLMEVEKVWTAALKHGFKPLYHIHA